jgi:hypothetical protein
MAMLDATSMPQLHPSIAPLIEQQPTAWTSDAPPTTERVRRSASDWMWWLFALALLAFFALFGFRTMLQALAGGWQWLWMPAGLPFAGGFSTLTVLHVVLRLREHRRLRVALENLSLERGEGFRVGEPLEVRLLATVPEAHQGERTLAPERITMRLMRQFVRGGANGDGALVNECCDEVVVPCDARRAWARCSTPASCARGPNTVGTHRRAGLSNCTKRPLVTVRPSSSQACGCCLAADETGTVKIASLLFGASAQDTGYSPPRMSPASLLLYFAAGSTRCPVHSGRSACAGRSTSALITLTPAVCSAQRNKGGAKRGTFAEQSTPSA